MLKKLMIAGIVFAMLFSFSACNEVTLKDYKEAAKIKLEIYAESKGESNYSEDSWEEIWNIVTEGKAMIGAAVNKPAIDAARDKAEEDINAVLTEEEERLNADFLLTISMEETILPQGEDFKVNVELKNQSGKNQELATFILYDWEIPNWIGVPINRELPEHPHFVFLDNNHSDISTILIGIQEEIKLVDIIAQEAGEYWLRVSANFYLNWGQENEQEMRILSNIIVLTVLKIN